MISFTVEKESDGGVTWNQTFSGMLETAGNGIIMYVILEVSIFKQVLAFSILLPVPLSYIHIRYVSPHSGIYACLTFVRPIL